MKHFITSTLLVFCLTSSLAWAITSFRSNATSRSVVLITNTPLTDTPKFKADVYINGTFTPMYLPSQLQYHINEKAFTQGKVYDAHVDLKTNAVLLSLGNERTVERVIIIIKNKYRTKFDHPEITLLGKTISVLGWVTYYKGDAAMKLNDPKDLQINTI